MTAESARILICDDEPHLREMVGEYLSERGYVIVEASDARAMYTSMDATPCDVIILDLNMPGEDGLSALKTLRKTHNTQVIMLTAACEVVDRVVGLEMGADDYLGKPVDLRELEARIKAALRRAPGRDVSLNQKDASKDANEPKIIAFGDSRLDVEGVRLIGPNGDDVPITTMEFELLLVFAENKGRVLNRDQLLEKAHNKGWEPFDRSVDLRISRLRRKIERNPSKPEIIRTVRGIGYIFG
ncbi:MAG: response regulator [Pseudomonadota bacterium]